ncbi:MAG: O-antigen ligase family protein [Acidobacteriia bacterium]|nr:O-antigen ligase family protein [Terriglobia bacterium]
MSQYLAAAIFLSVIASLFVLDRDKEAVSSRALWIPFVWLLISGSRNISEWLQVNAPPVDTTDAYLEGNPTDRNGLTLLLALGVIVLISRRRQVLAFLRANPFLVLYFFYCGLSALWSDYPDVSFKRWFRAMGDVIMVLVVLTDTNWVVAVRRLLLRVGFLLVPLSILFILFFPEIGRTYGRWDFQPSWTGVTTNKNSLGMVGMVYGLAGLWYFVEAWQSAKSSQRNHRLIAHGVFLSMVLWIIVKAHSATALSCFGFGAILILVTGLLPFTRRPLLLNILVAFVLVFAFSALFLNIGLVENLGRESNLTGRTDIWAAALHLTVNPVVGAGFESFWIGPRLLQMRSIDEGINQAHNGYLEIYLNLGAIGLLLILLFIFSGLRHIHAAFRRENDFAGLRLAYFVVAVIYSFTEAGFKMMHPIWIAFLLSTLAVPKILLPQSLPGEPA